MTAGSHRMALCCTPFSEADKATVLVCVCMSSVSSVSHSWGELACSMLITVSTPIALWSRLCFSQHAIASQITPNPFTSLQLGPDTNMTSGIAFNTHTHTHTPLDWFRVQLIWKYHQWSLWTEPCQSTLAVRGGKAMLWQKHTSCIIAGGKHVSLKFVRYVATYSDRKSCHDQLPIEVRSLMALIY